MREQYFCYNTVIIKEAIEPQMTEQTDKDEVIVVNVKFIWY